MDINTNEAPEFACVRSPEVCGDENALYHIYPILNGLLDVCCLTVND